MLTKLKVKDDLPPHRR